MAGCEADDNSAQLLTPRKVAQLLLQQSLFTEQPEVNGLPQQSSSQMLLEHAAAVLQEPPTPTEPAAMQKPQLHAPLVQTAFCVQKCPLPAARSEIRSRLAPSAGNLGKELIR